MRNTRTLAIAITILIGMFGGWFLATQTVEAEDTKGCEGLADYRVAIFKAGRDYLKALDEDGIPGSRDIFTY